MDELKRNGSGYVDPTAYNALKNISDKKINAGEIWEVEYHKEYRFAVVIAAQDRMCNILCLNEERTSEADIEVIAKGLKFTDPRMLSYKSNKSFVNFVRTMKEDEFEKLLDVVSGSLGFDAGSEAYEEAALNQIKELKWQLQCEKELSAKRQIDNEDMLKLLEEMKAKMKEQSGMIENLVTERDDLVEEKMELEHQLASSEFSNKKDEAKELQVLLERNFYKEQYEKIFERLLAG